MSFTVASTEEILSSFKAYKAKLRRRAMTRKTGAGPQHWGAIDIPQCPNCGASNTEVSPHSWSGSVWQCPSCQEHFTPLSRDPAKAATQQAMDKALAEYQRRAQVDGHDAAHGSLLSQLQMWPELSLPFQQAKELADHIRSQRDPGYANPRTANDMAGGGDREAMIDDWIETPAKDDWPAVQYCVVDTSQDVFGKLEYVVRVDRDGRDASRSGGEEGVDWEYMYIPAAEARVL